MGSGHSREDPSCRGACWHADPPREGPRVEGAPSPLGSDTPWGEPGAPRKKKAEELTLARRASWPEEPEQGPEWLAVAWRTAAATKDARAAVPGCGRGIHP